VLALARMIGCIIFLTPEDIMERKKELIFTLLAQLKHVSECGKQKKIENVVKKGELKQEEEKIDD
jgi:hypothetical protein